MSLLQKFNSINTISIHSPPTTKIHHFVKSTFPQLKSYEKTAAFVSSARYINCQTFGRFSLKCVYKRLLGCVQNLRNIKIGVSRICSKKKVAVLALRQKLGSTKVYEPPSLRRCTASNKIAPRWVPKISAPRAFKKVTLSPVYSNIAKKN